MLKNIASELVCESTNFMNFDKAQELAQTILCRIEGDGMLPPFDIDIFYNTWRDGGNGHVWEPEDEAQ